MGSAVDPGRADQNAINLFHPIYHSYTYPIGCRIDIERLLPVDLNGEDEEELVDNFSEPPVWVERFSPVAAQVGDQVIRGKNASDLFLKIYRTMFDLFQGIGRFIESSIQQSTGEATHYPFLSLCVDPDTLHRLIELDYESGETGYNTLMKLFANGTISPCLTTPFHNLLACLGSDAEVRLCVRSALIFYLRIIRIYSGFLERHGESGLLVLPFWLPEAGLSKRVLEILEEEFQAFCKREKFGNGHLVLMLDNHQAGIRENDILMKSWNVLKRDDPPPTRSRRGGEDKPQYTVSVVYRDRSFSDWVIHANPSVKKLLDRTIAKVDSDINQQNVHYGWAHFEELEAMTYTPRAIINFQQKLVKLTELGYLPLSPDFYVRGKLRGEFGCTTHEPQTLELGEPSVGNGWDMEKPNCHGRWGGLTATEDGGMQVVSHKFSKPGSEGKIEENGNGCWKVAWELVRAKIHQAVVGDLDTLQGGMAEVLAELTTLPADGDKTRRNVQDFLANYTYVYWREHFIQHDLAEADINIHELTSKYLRASVKGGVEAADAAMAGGAAQAIYFALHAGSSLGTGWENMDQRAFYQNVSLLTLALSNAIYVLHWRGDNKGARKLLNLLKTELLEFDTAFERYNLAQYGISATQWKRSLKSEIDDSKDNVVKRAALRVAARHLRPLGYTKEFTRQDANLTTNVGHIWSTETCRESFCYENTRFCGVDED